MKDKARVLKRRGSRFAREMDLRRRRVRGHHRWVTFVACLREHFEGPSDHPEVLFWRQAIEGVRHGHRGGISDAFYLAERQELEARRVR